MDGAITSGTTTLNSASAGFINAAFPAGDINMPVVIYGAGAADVPLTTTINAVASATQCTVGVAASTTVTAASVRIGHGYEIAVPVAQDTYQGDSMAAILALFSGKNKILDFKQLRETIPIGGFLDVPSALDAGFTNVTHMRDELIRIRGSHNRFGLNTGSTTKSWLQEGGSSSDNPPIAVPLNSADWGTATLPSTEQDSTTTRAVTKCRLVYGKYWRTDVAAYRNLFVYGTVANVRIGPRPGATDLTRIPYVLTFLAGEVEEGT